MLKRRVVQFLFGSLWLVLLSRQTTYAQTQPLVSITVSAQPDSTNYDVFISTTIVTNSDGSMTGALGLISITNACENVPFDIVINTPLLTIYAAQVVVPQDVLSKTYTLTWTNYTTGTDYSDSFAVGAAQFILFPQSQSAFVSNTVSFIAQASHTTGYQWQLNGTNLMEDGHFIGVTNAALTIANVQLADAGDYTVIASHPTNPASTDVSLGVYKPIQLGLAVLPDDGGFELLVANQDRSPFEPARIPNLQIFSTTDLTVDFAGWNLETNTGVISNGVLQIDFPDDGNGAKYWGVLEQ